MPGRISDISRTPVTGVNIQSGETFLNGPALAPEREAASCGPAGRPGPCLIDVVPHPTRRQLRDERPGASRRPVVGPRDYAAILPEHMFGDILSDEIPAPGGSIEAAVVAVLSARAVTADLGWAPGARDAAVAVIDGLWGIHRAAEHRVQMHGA